MIVFHHNDADGRAAAAVVLKWFGENGDRWGPDRCECIEMGYKDPLDLSRVERNETVVIVDFSFKPPEFSALQKHTFNIIWCDHHKTAKEYPYALGDIAGLRDFSDKGLSGCEVTWRFVFPHKPIPGALRLLGDYDAWRMEDKPRCLEFYEGLKLRDTSPRSVIWVALLQDPCPLIGQIVSEGQAAMMYRDTYCASIRKSFGYETLIDGHMAFAVNVFGFGSQGYGELFVKYPVCVAYIFDGKRFSVSLYSESVDVGEICKKFGGGGHRGAAGFVCEKLPFVPIEG
jgi:oligoribonuclease NrnB/cAMP/cGMP phosphodiesterase (DHH superfamily)